MRCQIRPCHQPAILPRPLDASIHTMWRLTSMHPNVGRLPSSCTLSPLPPPLATFSARGRCLGCRNIVWPSSAR
jgi:hypothetical protein